MVDQICVFDKDFHWQQLQLDLHKLKIPSPDDCCQYCKRKFSDPETRGISVLLPCCEFICQSCRHAFMHYDAIEEFKDYKKEKEKKKGKEQRKFESLSACRFCNSKIIAFQNEQGVINSISLHLIYVQQQHQHDTEEQENAIQTQKQLDEYFNMLYTVVKYLLLNPNNTNIPCELKDPEIIDHFEKILNLVKKHPATMRRIEALRCEFNNQPLKMIQSFQAWKIALECENELWRFQKLFAELMSSKDPNKQRQLHLILLKFQLQQHEQPVQTKKRRKHYHPHKHSSSHKQKKIKTEYTG